MNKKMMIINLMEKICYDIFSFPFLFHPTTFVSYFFFIHRPSYFCPPGPSYIKSRINLVIH